MLRVSINISNRNMSSARNIKTSHSDERYGVRPIKFRSLFRFCTACERFSLALGVFFAFIAAIGVPLINLVYGEFAKILIDRQYPSNAAGGRLIILESFGGGRTLINASRDDRMAALDEDAAALALSIFVFSAEALLFLGLSVFIFNFVSIRQIRRIKIELLKTLLSQSQAWYDIEGSINFTSKVSENLINIQNGTGERLSIFIYQMSIVVIITGMSLYVGWLLTLVLIGCLAPMLIIFIVLNQIQSGITANEIVSIENSTHVAEEAISNIRTVFAFNGEEHEIQRYSKKLLTTQGLGIIKSLLSGFGFSFVWIVTYSSFAVAFSLGFRLIMWFDEYTTAVLITVLFAVLTAATSLIYSGPYFDSFAAARGSAASIFRIIGTKSEINPFSDDGISRGEECNGEIEFKNVHFHYPSNPEVKILKGFNLKVSPGEKVAIVGSSGSGKSTVFQLIQRFYDPVEGEIYLDGFNLKSLNVVWLRNQITAILQEPKFFSTTIGSNIAIGLTHATNDQIIEAAKKANAHDFIMKLVDDYSTFIEGKDANLSGGQRQRIAIARALIRTSKILLLDEVTSALDRENEVLVGNALSEAAAGRTTITISHKISSLSNMDRIIILNDGVIAEEGTHEVLLNRKGIYSRLFKAESDNLAKANTSAKLTVRKVELGLSGVDEGYKYYPDGRTSFFSDFTLSSAEVERKVKDDRYVKVDCCRFLSWNKSHWAYLYFGLLASVLLGLMLPIVCIIYGELIGVLGSTGEDSLHRVDMLSITLVLIGLSAGILTFIQICFLGIASVRLTKYLKLRIFETMMRQEMAWFDSSRNSVSILCSLLNNDSSSIQGVIGSRVGVIVQGCISIFMGFCISVYYSWKMALVTIVAVPFIFIGIFLDVGSSTKQKIKELESEEKATKMAYEAIKNIKVVNSLGKESFFLAQYVKLLKTRRTCGRSFFRGFAYSLGQTTMFFCYALSLWYGANLIHRENIHYKDVLRISELIIYGCWMLGQAVALAPNFKKASEAAGRLQFLFVRRPKIQSGLANLPQFMTKDNMFEFSNVYFSYPARPDSAVLRNINFTVKEGESIALIGQSGSGKSTILQLILRLYDPNLGFITMKSMKLPDLKLSTYRQCIGLVSQEPALFDRTIYENIAYGDNEREVDLEEVIAAAKAANIHSFIDSLPSRYNTRLGPSSNSSLSGGQKQKIAIARALIRNPKILLLDEATSALDPASEQSVQETLDNVMSGLTTITVAHKWGAIAKADYIYVMEDGRIIESGTHSQLMKFGGVYSKMRKADY